MDFGDFAVGIMAGIVGGTAIGLAVPEETKQKYYNKYRPLIARHTKQRTRGTFYTKDFARGVKTIEPIIVETNIL